MPLMFVRRAQARGLTRRPGVETRHAFSGGDYHDPAWTGFGVLRALNELVLAPGVALPPQRRANMEILSLVLDGTLAAEGGALGAGDLLRLRAGHGHVAHEANASAEAPLRMLQLWLQPDRVNLPPDVATMPAPVASAQGMRTVAARGLADALPLESAAAVAWGRLGAGAALDLPVGADRRAWLQVLAGGAVLGGETLGPGDAAAWAGTGGRVAAGRDGADLLLVTLP
ncbi:pirin family protein [Coralloluteibacterium thermophilus]|uniref:Pirin family protein n=1 Tax=Coralloluteibacterium thermophilum TaxID=2707049 RepID=A0ABV9NG14_9GAMM